MMMNASSRRMHEGGYRFMDIRMIATDGQIRDLSLRNAFHVSLANLAHFIYSLKSEKMVFDQRHRLTS